MSLTFCPLASGSSGNSIYIATKDTRILIDAGLSGKQLALNLSEAGFDISSIDGIFVTHEHSDHIKGVGVLSRRFDVPVYATPGTWEQMDKYAMIGKVDERNRRYVYKEETCIINDICVKPFEIPHDAAEPVGYTLSLCNRKISVATDIGHITDTIKENLSQSEIILLESNHDIEMLKTGSYPERLKRRILGKNGHLSNISAGQFLAEIMTGALSHVFLGHLSAENNRPELAYETVSQVLGENKIIVDRHLRLHMAERYTASLAVEL